MAYRDLAKRKKAEQAARIPKSRRVDTSYLFQSGEKSIIKQLTPENAPSFWSKRLSEKEIEITTGNDAVDIVNGIRKGTWSAEEVTTSFCKRAALAHQLVICDFSMSKEGINEVLDKLPHGDLLRGSHSAGESARREQEGAP